MTRNESRRAARQKLENFKARVRIEAETQEDVWAAAKSMGVQISRVYPLREGGGYFGYGTRVCLRNKIDAKIAATAQSLVGIEENFAKAALTLIGESNGRIFYEDARSRLAEMKAPIADANDPDAMARDLRQFISLKRQWRLTKGYDHGTGPDQRDMV